MFAIPMRHLQEVLPVPALCRLPGAEPVLAGLMKLRDHVLPVFDPLSMAHSAAVPHGAPGIVIVLILGDQPVLGLLADTVGKVVELTVPGPLSGSVRMPTAFSGEVSAPDQARMLVVDVPAFANDMGLMELPPADP